MPNNTYVFVSLQTLTMLKTMQIKELLIETVKTKSSDLFVTGAKVAYMRKAGQLEKAGAKVIAAATVDEFRKTVLGELSEVTYQSKGSFDAGFTLENGMRFRINFFTQQGLPGFVARPLPLGSGLSFRKLNLPPLIEEFASEPRGLILVSGSAGSGKSTTMACVLNYINQNFNKHIVTIEDPIEFVHEDGKSLVTQREVGSDSESFAEALKNVVRESPDVIAIGEMRDFETMQTAITAALTGHLVISTVHTSDTIQTVERIINHFPEHLRGQAASDLSIALKGIIAQRLVPMKEDGLIPAVEIMKITPMIRNLIADRNFKDLDESIKRGSEEGMVTFNRAISELYKSGKITLKAGVSASSNHEEFLLLTEGMESGIETFRDGLKTLSLNDGELSIKRLLHSAIANKASDLLITAGSRPSLRIDGDLRPLDTAVLSASDTKRLFFSIITPRQRALFEEKKELDFALTVNSPEDGKEAEGLDVSRRFRVNGFYQRGNVATAIRIIPQIIPQPEELGMPPVLLELVDKKSGLILVTGPTGHGKSTTQASLIDRINSKRPCHIITVEDPIEYVHSNKKAVVEQREVHADTFSFSNALKYVLRQDPDVILIGEMRDTETIAAALTAAETGHLVMATLHTNDAPQSVDRIIDSFPAHQQNQIKVQLAGTLLGIVAQRLIPRIDRTGRVAAFEILVGVPGIKALIREGKTHQLQSMIETNSKDGMITMEKSLKDLYSRGIISREELESLVGIKDRKANY